MGWVAVCLHYARRLCSELNREQEAAEENALERGEQPMPLEKKDNAHVPRSGDLRQEASVRAQGTAALTT